jgi:4-amino-4-deoxy-L-arabinose transferase-like glycosyltransferase
MLQDLKSQSSGPLQSVLSRMLAIPKHGLIALTLLVGFVLRLFWMLRMAPAISFEAEYVRVAENLRAGLGLMSSYGGAETMYAPLYSILIAGFTLVARDAEFAAHLVSLLFGTLLIVPVYLITLRVYGQRAAYLSAFLVALHPLLIARSGSIYSEAVYPTLLMAALYWGIKSLELGSARYYFLCGAFFGLAYLTRPEAFAYPAFFAFVLFAMPLLTRKGFATAIVAPGLVLAGFLLIAFPYILFLRSHTGQWRLEGKWNMNYTAGMRMHAGLNSPQAHYGIDQNQQEVGPLLDPERAAGYTPYPHGLRDKLSYMLFSIRKNRGTAYATFLSTVFGQPFLLILIAIGLFRFVWSPQRLLHEFVLATMVLSIFILVLTAHHVELRYADPCLVLTIPWAAKGLVELGAWAQSTAESLIPNLVSRTTLVGIVAQLAICIPMLTLSFADTRSLTEFTIEGASYLDIKQAGLWLKNQKPGEKRIAAINAVVPLYAQGTLVQYPYAEPAQTFRYLDSRNVDFIALEGIGSDAFPTMAEWLTHGIPNPRARLVYDSGGPAETRIEIYRWQESGGTAVGN